MESKFALGVDVGGVIIDRVNDKTDTSFFGENYLKSKAVPEAFETLSKLMPIFGSKIYIVSKCGWNIQQKTLRWMAHNDFHIRTGIEVEQVFFCRERREKAPICQNLKLTHFIDDRLEVLSYLQSVRHRYLFRPTEREVLQFSKHLPKVVRVDFWADIYNKIIRTLS